MTPTGRNIAITFLFYGAASPISAAIRWQTRSQYSHVAILLPPGIHPDITVPTVIEAREFRGVIRRPLDEADQRAAAYVAYYPDILARRATDWLFDQVDKPYDYTMVLRFLTRRQETRRSTGKWFCSELAFAYAAKLGIAPLSETQPWEASPGLLARSPLLFRHRDHA